MKYEISYKGVILPHHYFADLIIWDKIVLEAKAVERLTEAHVKQVLNYLAAAKLKLGLLVISVPTPSNGNGLFSNSCHS